MSASPGALGFLSAGTTPGSASSETQTQSQLPSWYTDYTQQILNTAAQWAAQPYQTYGGPRIAQQSDLTNDAYAGAPGIGANASAGTQASSNLITQAMNANNPLGTAAPNLAQGTADVSGSIAPGQGGLAAAAPYLNNASANSYNNVNSYMNPYNENVTNAISNAANTNFNNYTMPALKSSIIGAGNITGNSTEGANLMMNAEQQNNQNITNAQAGALEQGYQGSLNAAQTDLARQASLAGTAGTLGTAEQTAEQNAGTDIANIGATAGNLNSAGVNNTIEGAGALSNITSQGTNEALNASANENTLGEQNQGYTQANENLAYNDFENQLNHPLTAASAMQGALAGIQVPTATNVTGYGTSVAGTVGPSPITAAAGALGAIGAASQPTYDPTIPKS